MADGTAAGSTPLRRIVVLAGAGMSAELGVPTYWTGQDARYGAQVSAHGFTDFDHAQAGLWETEPLMQAAFFAGKVQALAQVDPLADGSPYVLLNELLAKAQEHVVVTSNPDSMFQRSGIKQDALFEVHGSYRNAQCLTHPKRHGIFPTLIEEGLLRCPECGSLARPNVLFFDDYRLLEDVYRAQRWEFEGFLTRCHPGSTLVLEIGAGAMVPTIRNLSLRLNRQYDLRVVRINPHAHEDIDVLSWAYPQNPEAPFSHMLATASDGLRRLLNASDA